jgi:hypothetical protein
MINMMIVDMSMTATQLLMMMSTMSLTTPIPRGRRTRGSR